MLLLVNEGKRFDETSSTMSKSRFVVKRKLVNSSVHLLVVASTDGNFDATTTATTTLLAPIVIRMSAAVSSSTGILYLRQQ